jgi:hypothetical protein
MLLNKIKNELTWSLKFLTLKKIFLRCKTDAKKYKIKTDKINYFYIQKKLYEKIRKAF